MTSFRINRREIVVAAASLAAGSAFAKAAPGMVSVLMTTDQGPITLDLDAAHAPITVKNFLHYVDTKRLDGAEFFRATRAPGAPTVGLIEGGIQDDARKLFKPIAHESTTQTGLRHKDGTISMAREAPGTATATFFICSGDAAYLDAHPDAPGDNLGYAAFGQVTNGMDVVRKILALPTPGVARNPVMKGQILDPPVKILSVQRQA